MTPWIFLFNIQTSLNLCYCIAMKIGEKSLAVQFLIVSRHAGNYGAVRIQASDS